MSHGSSGVATDAQGRLLAIVTLVRWLRSRKMAEASAPSASVLISEAQGMCTDHAPHEEINMVLDRAQRALDS